MAALYDDGVSGIDLPECDVRHPCEADTGSYLDTAVGQGAETVWHLAALNDATQTFYDRPWDVLNTQIRGTLNVIDACVANGVKTLVLFSSSEVYQTPPVIPTPEDVPLVVPDLKNPRYSYGGGKIAAELLAWWSAIPRVIIIRPHNVYGPGQGKGHVIPDMIERSMVLPPDGTLLAFGSGQRSYCYVDDFIAGALLAAEKGADRDVFHIGGGNEVTTYQLGRYILDARGYDATRTEVSVIDGPAGGTARRCPDTAKIRALGWSHATGLREGLAKTIAWHREQKR